MQTEQMKCDVAILSKCGLRAKEYYQNLKAFLMIKRSIQQEDIIISE